MSKNKKTILFIEMEERIGPFKFPSSNRPYNSLLLATILKNNGHNVVFCHESELKKLKNMHYGVVCIGYVTANANKAYKLASFFKSQGKKVILGGVHASMLPEEAAKYADHVIVGEGDLVINNSIEGKYKDKIIYGKMVNNLDNLPIINKGFFKQKRHLDISTSRGCIFKCNFCTVRKMFGDTYRFRSPQSIANEIYSFPYLKSLRSLYFIDDNFAAIKGLTKETLKELKNHGLDSRVKCGTQCDITIAEDKELLKLLGDFGFTIYIGIESTSRDTLKSYNKLQNLNLNLKSAIKIIKDYGIKILACNVMGSDADTTKTLKKGAEEFKSLDLDLNYANILTPYPGTDIYNKFKKEGRMMTYNWDLFNCNFVTYKPKKMKAHELQRIYLDNWHSKISPLKISISGFKMVSHELFNFDIGLKELLVSFPRAIKDGTNFRKALENHMTYLEKNNL